MKDARDPIAQLMQEHDEALTQLKLLNKAVSSFRQNGYTSAAYKQIRVALRFIEQEVTEHNHKEETALFPVLERSVVGPTRVLRNDHRKLHSGFSKLNKAVDSVNKNRDSFSAIKKMALIAKDVVQLFVNHIHKENYILFPLVQQFISKEEMREVARKML